jgi:RNA polymerase sigma-70 factor, ECF subfamily
LNFRTTLKDSLPSPHKGNVRASAVYRLPSGPEEERAAALQVEGKIQLSFDDIYRKWFHEVCRWSRALGGLHADVEDIAQEVFMVVRRKLDDFDGAHPRAWLYRITQRTVSDYRRRAWFRRAVRPASDWFAQVMDPAQGPREIVQQRQEVRQVAAILEKMSTVRRAAFILFEIEGYSGEEIAELEQVPLATVYTRLHHARKDFIKHVERLAEEVDS